MIPILKERYIYLLICLYIFVFFRQVLLIFDESI